ncbi:MAG: DUF2666 family protein [Candidatus Micrarchaeia archaeon]
MDEPSEYIDFMAKYKDWIAIKRLGIREDTKPEEIVHHMAGIKGTIEGKIYSIIGINTDIIDSFVESITKGKRKSYEALAEVIGMLGGAQAKSAITEACNGKPFEPLAEAYLLGKVIRSFGYETSISQEAMAKIFPDLKIPKVGGRKKK